jgi:general secretion pathway protein N
MMPPHRRLARVLIAVLCVAAPTLAAPPPGFGDPSTLGIDNAGLDVTGHALPPPEVTKPREAAAPSANPLWTIPLTALSATRNRPLFEPSRRPPASVTTNAPIVAAHPLPPAAPERPNLDLVGTVAGGAEGMAIFIDQATRNAVRLRTGEGHLGWILQSVDRRTATLQKSGQSETLELPQHANLPGSSPVVSALAVLPPIPVVDQHRGCPQELFGCRMQTE